MRLLRSFPLRHENKTSKHSSRIADMSLERVTPPPNKRRVQMSFYLMQLKPRELPVFFCVFLRQPTTPPSTVEQSGDMQRVLEECRHMRGMTTHESEVGHGPVICLGCMHSKNLPVCFELAGLPSHKTPLFSTINFLSRENKLAGCVVLCASDSVGT